MRIREGVCMPLKYGSVIASIPGCPPTKCEPCSREAFRFVFDPICARSFVPVALMKPSRGFANDGLLCVAHALSFFTTQDLAIATYSRVKKGHRQISNKIGSHLATGRLEAADGIATKPSSTGHFAFFEEEGCDLVSRFHIVEKLR
jgi:hypothetical protein